jgi:hypothetical protein
MEQLEWNIVLEGIPVPLPVISGIPAFQPFQLQVVLAFRVSQYFLLSGVLVIPVIPGQ